MRIRRKKREPVEEGHYFKRSKTLEIWICVSDHQCCEVRDRYGLPLRLEGEPAIVGHTTA